MSEDSKLYPVIQFRIDAETKKTFKKAAEAKGTTISAVLKGHINEYVASYWRDERMSEAVKAVHEKDSSPGFLD